MSNLTEPESLLKEIANQTSGELTSVEVIAYVEALCQSASMLAAGENDYTVKPSVINSTLSVCFVYQSWFSFTTWSFCLSYNYALNWFTKKGKEKQDFILSSSVLARTAIQLFVQRI